jgi:hypothetical protein
MNKTYKKYNIPGEQEENLFPRKNKIKYFLRLFVDFFKIRSFSELFEKIIYILGALISVGFIIVLGAMIGWFILIGLVAVAVVLTVLKLFWLWYVR